MRQQHRSKHLRTSESRCTHSQLNQYLEPRTSLIFKTQRALHKLWQSGDIKRLAEAGYHTVDSLTMTSRRALAKVKGISDTKCDKIMEAAGKLCPRRLQFVTAAELRLDRQERVKHITTGSKELDRILGGGIETGSITMVYGEHRCGKTQLYASHAIIMTDHST